MGNREEREIGSNGVGGVAEKERMIMIQDITSP